MKLQSIKKSLMSGYDSFRISNEKGMVLIFCVAAVLALFIITALAIDSGNLFLAQLRTQRAVDAAATATAPLLGEKHCGIEDCSDIEARAKLLAEKNLQEMGLDPSCADCVLAKIGVDSTARFAEDYKIEVEARMPVNLFFPGLLSGAPNPKIVFAEAHGKTRKVIVALVLDRSGSMNCDGAPGCTKFQDTKDAAKRFVSYFNPDADNMALVSFSSSSSVNVPMQTSPGFNLDTVTTAIDGLVSNGTTNIEDAMLAARREIEKLSASPSALRLIVFMTDGAPTTSNCPAGYTCPTGSSRTNDDRKLDYLRALAESDKSRERGYLVFSIGLGDEASEVLTDYELHQRPYQRVGSTIPIKTFFLRRLANDARGHIDTTDGGGLVPDPTFPGTPSPVPSNGVPVPTIPPYDQIIGRPTGKYFHARNAADLDGAFYQIYRTIKTMLVR